MSTLVEERVVLFEAKDFEDAIEQAESDAHQYCERTKFVNIYGQSVKLNFLGAVDAFAISDVAPSAGCEVYSFTAHRRHCGTAGRTSFEPDIDCLALRVRRRPSRHRSGEHCVMAASWRCREAHTADHGFWPRLRTFQRPQQPDHVSFRAAGTQRRRRGHAGNRAPVRPDGRRADHDPAFRHDIRGCRAPLWLGDRGTLNTGGGACEYAAFQRKIRGTRVRWRWAHCPIRRSAGLTLASPGDSQL
jgi:Domain of unknown function (DUF4288)